MKKALFFVILAAALLRLYRLDLPFVEPYNSLSRQAIVATVARNFYQHGFNFLYPEIDENGKGPYLYNAEMPIYSYLMAMGYKIVGGVREGAARSVSVFFSFLTLWGLYFFIRRLFSERLAFWALVFAALSPLNLALSRSIQPEATMMAASVWGLYFFYRYKEGGGRLYFWGAVAAFFLTIATRIYLIYLFIPMGWIAWHFEKGRMFRNRANYFFVFLSSLALFWYLFMWQEGRSLSLIYSPYTLVKTRGPADKSTLELFAWPYLWPVLKAFFVHLLTVTGSIFFIKGIFSKWVSEKEKFFWVWLASTLFYLLFFWRTTIDHSYYLLPLLGPLAFFVAKGVTACLDSVSTARTMKNPLVITLLASLTLFNVLYFYRGLYFIPEKSQAIVEAGKFIQENTPKDSLVIASHGGSSIQLYYCNRKGWVFDIRNRDVAKLKTDFEALIKEGASFYVISNVVDLKEVPEFEAYLRKHYRLSKETAQFQIFQLG